MFYLAPKITAVFATNSISGSLLELYKMSDYKDVKIEPIEIKTEEIEIKEEPLDATALDTTLAVKKGMKTLFGKTYLNFDFF